MGDNFVCVGQKPTRKCPAGEVVGTTAEQTLTNKNLVAPKIGGVTVTATADQLNNLTTVLTVANKTGGKLNKGTLVYINGYDVELGAPTVAKASLTQAATHVLPADIENNEAGSADGEATVTGIDTDAFSAIGDAVYLAADGAFSHEAATGANEISQIVGQVVTKNDTTGSIKFFPAYHDVRKIGSGGLQGGSVGAAALGVTAGTLAASKALVVNSAKHIDEINVASLKLGATGATVAVTATAAELNTAATYVDNLDVPAVDLNAGYALVGAMTGASVSAEHDTDTATPLEILAANAGAAGDRAVMVIVKGAETLAATTDLPVFEIGEEDGAVDKFAKIGHGGSPSTFEAGAIAVFAGTLTEAKALQLTVTDGTGGEEAGAIQIFVIALPVATA